MNRRKTVLLTGATGLLGRTFAKALLAEDWTVLAGGRSAARLEATRVELGASTDRFVPLVFDVGGVDFDALAADLDARGLSPRGLINNARDVSNLAGAAPWPSRDAWLAEFATGVAGPVGLTVALARATSSVLESVVNVSSIYGLVAPDPAIAGDPAKTAPMHYGTTKAALVHATKELAVRLAPRVRVNAVSYGGVGGRADADFVARYARRTPQGRMLESADIPGPVLFLLSSAASGTTGHNLVTDGGWTLW